MVRGHSLEPGEITGYANCPKEVQDALGLRRYRRVALTVCQRVCAREMEPMGLTPNGIELAGAQPCATYCKEARVLYPPNGVIPRPEVAPLPEA